MEHSNLLDSFLPNRQVSRSLTPSWRLLLHASLFRPYRYSADSLFALRDRSFLHLWYVTTYTPRSTTEFSPIQISLLGSKREQTCWTLAVTSSEVSMKNGVTTQTVQRTRRRNLRPDVGLGT